MRKKYIVRLTEEERQKCQEVIRKLQATSRKVRRAQILLKADADGSACTDQQIAEAFGCRPRTVDKVRQFLGPRATERRRRRRFWTGVTRTVSGSR